MAKEKKKEEDTGFDFGVGGLFNGIEKLVDLAAKLKEAGGEIKQEGEIDLSHLKKRDERGFWFFCKVSNGWKTRRRAVRQYKKDA